LLTCHIQQIGLSFSYDTHFQICKGKKHCNAKTDLLFSRTEKTTQAQPNVSREKIEIFNHGTLGINLSTFFVKEENP